MEKIKTKYLPKEEDKKSLSRTLKSAKPLSKLSEKKLKIERVSDIFWITIYYFYILNNNILHESFFSWVNSVDSFFGSEDGGTSEEVGGWVCSVGGFSSTFSDSIKFKLIILIKFLLFINI